MSAREEVETELDTILRRMGHDHPTLHKVNLCDCTRLLDTLCAEERAKGREEAQDAVTRARREALEECREEFKEWRCGRVCLYCKFARVEIVEGDKDPREADTYCGNDESPCFDRTVSFFGDDTCAHFEKGSPVHETRAARLAGEEG